MGLGSPRERWDGMYAARIIIIIHIASRDEYSLFISTKLRVYSAYVSCRRRGACVCVCASPSWRTQVKKEKKIEKPFLRYRFHSLLFCVGCVRLATGASWCQTLFHLHSPPHSDCLCELELCLPYSVLLADRRCCVHSSRKSKQTRLNSDWKRRVENKRGEFVCVVSRSRLPHEFVYS